MDDHVLVREGFRRLLAGERDLEVCGDAEDKAGTLRAVETLKPDLVTLDLCLRGNTGMSLLRDLVRRHPGVPVLVVTSHDETFYGEPVLRAGARGFVMKRESGGELLQAIRTVLSGKVYLSPRMASRLVDRLSGRGGGEETPLGALSERELEVYHLIGKGLSMRRIAATLHVSVKTAESHRENIKEKLGLATSRELLRHAVLWCHVHTADE